MTRRKNEDQRVEFECIGLCEDEEAPTWIVEGRFNALGEFEPFDMADAECPECQECGEPTGDEVLVDA